MFLKVRIAVCLMVGLCLTAGVAHAARAWNFDQETEGWIVVDLPAGGPYHDPVGAFSLSHSSGGGWPGGHVYRTDPSVNTFAFSMPFEDLLTLSAYAGGTLEFALRSSQQTWTSEAFVILAGVDEAIRAAIPVPSASWTDIQVPLVAASFVDAQDQPVSPEDFAALLEEIQGLYIVAEYGSGNTELTRLDSVRLWNPCGELAATSLGIQCVAGEPTLVQLSWDPVPGAASYEILLRDGAWGLPQSLAFTPGTTWSTPAPAAGRGFFQVRALRVGGGSGRSRFSPGGGRRPEPRRARGGGGPAWRKTHYPARTRTRNIRTKT